MPRLDTYSHIPASHAVSIVSVLHLALYSLGAFSQTHSPHLGTVLAHKASTLDIFRSTDNSITAPTFEPAFGASSLLTVCFRFAPRRLHDGVVFDTIDLIAQMMTLFRGTVAIFQFARQTPNSVPSGTMPRYIDLGRLQVC
ncbi:hypothetical protein F4819DRAFT_470796 [Hypoxylon fuscum]|nr:hypothetical protein F4819DRAFT_470796 [Hypoxylon fuscum]